MSSPVSAELAAAQEEWRLRKKREEKEREKRLRFFQDNDVETDDDARGYNDEEVTVFVPFDESSDAEKLAVYKDFSLALIDRGFLFKHLYWTNKSTTRELRGAIYKKSNRSSREGGAGPSGAKKAKN